MTSNAVCSVFLIQKKGKIWSAASWKVVLSLKVPIFLNWFRGLKEKKKGKEKDEKIK